MATPVADPLTAVDPQADLGFAAGATITQSGSRVQNADGSEVWTYTLANYTTPSDTEVLRLQHAASRYAAPVVGMLPTSVLTTISGTGMTITAYQTGIPVGSVPNTTEILTEDLMIEKLMTHLTVMRDTYMAGGDDPVFHERTGTTFDFRVGNVDPTTMDAAVLDTIIQYAAEKTATDLSLTPASIEGQTFTAPLPAGTTPTTPATLDDVGIRINSGSQIIPVDNPAIGGVRPPITVTSSDPSKFTVSVLPDNTGIVITPVDGGDATVTWQIEGSPSTGGFVVSINKGGLPVATLIGDAAVNVENGATYTDAGYTNPNPAADQTVTQGGDVLNTSVNGVYTLTWTFTNSFGTVVLTRVVTVQDTTAPVITLNGTDNQTVTQGAAYVEAGATAGGGEAVTVSGTVDTATLGTYTITYSATDASGNTGTATRSVFVTLAAGGYSPVFTSETDANAASPDGTSHPHVIDGITYYMPDNNPNNVMPSAGTALTAEKLAFVQAAETETLYLNQYLYTLAAGQVWGGEVAVADFKIVAPASYASAITHFVYTFVDPADAPNYVYIAQDTYYTLIDTGNSYLSGHNGTAYLHDALFVLDGTQDINSIEFSTDPSLTPTTTITEESDISAYPSYVSNVYFVFARWKTTYVKFKVIKVDADQVVIPVATALTAEKLAFVQGEETETLYVNDVLFGGVLAPDNFLEGMGAGAEFRFTFTDANGATTDKVTSTYTLEDTGSQYIGNHTGVYHLSDVLFVLDGTQDITSIRFSSSTYNESANTLVTEQSDISSYPSYVTNVYDVRTNWMSKCVRFKVIKVDASQVVIPTNSATTQFYNVDYTTNTVVIKAWEITDGTSVRFIFNGIINGNHQAALNDSYYVYVPAEFNLISITNYLITTSITGNNLQRGVDWNIGDTIVVSESGVEKFTLVLTADYNLGYVGSGLPVAAVYPTEALAVNNYGGGNTTRLNPTSITSTEITFENVTPIAIQQNSYLYESENYYLYIPDTDNTISVPSSVWVRNHTKGTWFNTGAYQDWATNTRGAEWDVGDVLSIGTGISLLTHNFNLTITNNQPTPVLPSAYLNLGLNGLTDRAHIKFKGGDIPYDIKFYDHTRYTGDQYFNVATANYDIQIPSGISNLIFEQVSGVTHKVRRTGVAFAGLLQVLGTNWYDGDYIDLYNGEGSTNLFMTVRLVVA